MIDKKLLEFCATPRQEEAINTLLEAGGTSAGAKAMGIGLRPFQRLIARVKKEAARQGYSPEHGMVHTVPDGFAVKGTSTLHHSEKGQVLQWVKTSRDAERQKEMMLEAIRAAAEEIPAEASVPGPAAGDNADLLSLYVITDYHLGMLSWGEETGEDWDTDIAEDLLYRWFERAVLLAPAGGTAVFAQLGDFMHWDGMEAVTPTSHHILDADTRFQRLVRVAVRALRRIIRLLLQRHDAVRIIMAEGNHDMASSVWLREIMAALYEDEPRATVERSPSPYYCVEHGDVSLFFHHGHKRKPGQIAEVFAAQFREVLGRTKYSYAHMGHMHHQDVKETPLMTIEQHCTLAAPDAYASRGGYVSDRAARVITYHKTDGEVSRVRIPPAAV